MIARLRGLLVSKRAESATIEVGGVGYEVALTPRSLAALPGVGEEVVIHTHTYVREDELSLFGFENEADRDLFRILLGASGVGPRVAQSILATLDHGQIVRAIATDDPDILTAAPGVGKRGAQKIVLELGPKFTAYQVGSEKGAAVTVRQALESLGYSVDEINGVMTEIDPSTTLEDQVKTALQALGRR